MSGRKSLALCVPLHAIVAAGETYSYDRDLTEAQARKLWLLEPPGSTVVAVDADGTVVGTAKMNPNQMGLAHRLVQLFIRFP